MRAPIVALVLLAAVASLASPARAGGMPDRPGATHRHPLLSWRPAPWKPTPAAATFAIAAGLRVEIDPATGELVTPGAASLPAAGASPGGREAGLMRVTRPDGSSHVVVGDRLRRWSVASVGADGALRQECLDSEAAAILRAAAAARAAKEGR